MKKSDIKYRQGRSKRQVENSYKMLGYSFIALIITLTLTAIFS